MNSSIKFIYFDIGGVVVLDFSKTDNWHTMTSEWGVTDANRSEFEKLFDTYETAACTGQQIDEFIAAARSELGLKFPEGYSILDDFVDRFKPNVSLHPLLTELSREYRLGLLTNMYLGMLDGIKDHGFLPDTKWECVVDSSVVGFRKPQDGIFELAEELAHVAPENILFVENSLMHIESAQKRGWQTLLYDPSDLIGSNAKVRMLLLDK